MILTGTLSSVFFPKTTLRATLFFTLRSWQLLSILPISSQLITQWAATVWSKNTSGLTVWTYTWPSISTTLKACLRKTRWSCPISSLIMPLRKGIAWRWNGKMLEISLSGTTLALCIGLSEGLLHTNIAEIWDATVHDDSTQAWELNEHTDVRHGLP